MCAVRVSGLGRGDGIAGVVLARSSGAGPGGGVVMAGVLAHHLHMVRGIRGQGRVTSQRRGRCDFPLN